MLPYSTDIPWRLDPAVTFLNHGSFGATPVSILEAQRAWRDRMEAEPVRFLGRDLEGLLDAARVAVAAFIGADPDGVAFVTNATTGVATILRSLRFEPDDELLTTDHEYNAIGNALAFAAGRDRARVVVARIGLPIQSADAVVAAVLDAVTPRTRLAVVSHVTSPTAAVFPIERIVGELDARGVDTLVDAAHGPGMVETDVARLGAAYWTGNGHKWLCGPKGAAVLYVRGDRRDRIRPLVVSHGRNDRRTDRSRFRLEFDWTGTLDPTPYLALADAIRIVGGLAAGGWPEIMASNRALALDGLGIVAEAIGGMPAAPASMIGSMAAVVVPWLATDGGAAALHRSLVDEALIEVPVHGWPVPAARRRPDGPPDAVLVRLSAQRYNEPADYERLAAELRRRMGRRAG